MDEELATPTAGKPIRKIVIITLVIASLILISLVYFLIFSNNKSSQKGQTPDKEVNIPTNIQNNKFGFLSGGSEDSNYITEVGAAWARPHPGPFLWDAMQTSQGNSFDFKQVDGIIQGYQSSDVGILATLWPFAEWDQQNRNNKSDCQVSTNDEFLPKHHEKGRGDYLPLHRCNPNDFGAYTNWIKAVVERYDGDGFEDMPGLTIPIKYWEVMNEPDLTSPEPEPRLDFYKGNANDYAELLTGTNSAIKTADPEAKTVIAGAAGGNNQFLDFYRQVFAMTETYYAFDIANVHCISNDSYDSFNVEPYKALLTEFHLTQPIWVTEAEVIISTDADINASQTFDSTKKALALGAEKIFFTRFSFDNKQGRVPPSGGKPIPAITLSGSNAQSAYKTIIQQ